MQKKARKTRRQLQLEKETRAKQLVDKVNAEKNPFELFHKYHKYEGKDNLSVHLSCVKATEASSECVSWIFDIMKRNMKTMYEQCSWGWDAEAKQKELTEPTAWYLIATCDQKFVGFSHFRFDIDHKDEVLYCYELQLEPFVRGKGLGRFMMSALESMASYYKMQKVVLTVLKHNPSALCFFQALRYKLDVTSPSESEKQDYVIMSKRNLILKE